MDLIYGIRFLDGAWNNGEPGLFFIDTINKYHPLKDYEYLSVANPCIEQPLSSYGSCVLGSINLSKHLNDNKNGYDFSKLK